MGRLHRFWLVAIALQLACAGIAPDRQPVVAEAERRAYSDALAQLADDPAGAERSLTAFVQQWPDSPLAADAAFRLGEMAQARDDDEAALRRFYYVVRNYPKSQRVDAARLGVATLEFERGRSESAVRMLAKTRLSRLTDEERHRAHRLIVDTEESPIAKIAWLSRLRAGERDPDAQSRIDAEIDELMAGLDGSALEAVADRVEPEIPAARALVGAAERALDAGDTEEAADAIERASSLPLAAAYTSRLALVADRLRLFESGDTSGAPLPSFEEAAANLPHTEDAVGTIGVVVPLTGPFAEFGQESLKGVLLAAGAFDSTRPRGERPRVRVLVRDSGSGPQSAAAAVRDLAFDSGVVAIVGPLLKEACEAAASQAEREDIPLVALTSRHEIATGRSYVFRVRTTPDDEVRVLADHAMRDLGAQRFGILYPKDRYGRGLSGLFWRAVEERGGRVVALASYETDAVDFADPIRRMIGYELLTPAEKEVIKAREELIKSARRLPAEEALAVREQARAMLGPDDEPLPPIVDFDALFIPESHEKVVLIAPQLAFHEATGARLLGTDAWNDPELVAVGGEHVNGARFTASFYRDSSISFVREFADRYAATFGVPAEEMSAQAYDAANLVIAALARGSDSRSSVRDALLSTRAYPGVSGVLSMQPDGNARKRPFLVGVNRGKLVEVE